MKENIMCSFIVPCYNTAVYLPKCLNSIIRQTYKNWEIIVINDGSTDNTADIAYSYAKNDNRIKVFSQKNQGASAARNKALEAARGDYIIFLDSDDWYKDENCLEQIIKTSDNGDADIVVFRYQQVLDESHLCKEEYLLYFEKMAEFIYTGEEYLQIVLSKDEVYQWYLCLYAFKRELWSGAHVFFDTELCALEDMDILYKVILKAQNLRILNRPVYQYRVAREGALTTRTKKLMHNMLAVYRNNINTVNEMNINEDLKKLLNSNFSIGYFWVLAEINYLDKSDKTEIFNLLNENRNLMNYATRKKNVFIRRLVNILGFHITAKLLFAYHKW